MRKTSHLLILFVLTLLFLPAAVSAQRYEKVPFGDFESWTVRYIKESAVLGGNTKPIYMVAPKDTIRANAPYDYKNTIWSTSNAYAVVMGITKTSCSAVPDKGPTGTCAKLETVYAACKVVGVVNIKVVASGSIFWGKSLEPINGTKNPFGHMDWGIPFTKRPAAVVLDYRSVVPNTGKLAKGSKTIDGYDPESVMLILQRRWEDNQGNIHAERVGTAWYHIDKSSNGWVKNFRIPVIYGDARKNPSFKAFMGLLQGDAALYALNSKGKCVPIIEEGWASPDAPVTHAVMSIASGSREAYVGAIGNILWVDNIRLEY